MNKTRHRQLELPVLSNVNAKSADTTVGSPASCAVPAVGNVRSFHKSASAEDQSIYQSMSDNYFRACKK